MADDVSKQCAASTMDTFHMMMRSVRTEMRKRSPLDISMHQFHAMKTIQHHEGASLSVVSEHLGSSLSAASKLIDGLVERGYVHRETAEDDRRRLILAITEAGEQAMESVDLEVQSFIAEKLAALSPNERAIVNLAMDVLRSALITPTGQSMGIKDE